jgi:hypothetical protein
MNNSSVFILLAVLSIFAIAYGIHSSKEKQILNTTNEEYQRHASIQNETHTVTSVELVKVKNGTVTGVVGTILTALLWLLYLFTGGVTVIQTAMLNGYTLTAAAALVSIFGICFHDASCMLLAAISLVGAVLVDWSTFLGLIPAILLMVSHVKMKKRYGLEVTEKEE